MRQQEPLTPEELEQLRRRGGQMAWFHAAAMATLMIGAVGISRYGDLAWFRHALVAAVAVLVLAGAVLQLRQRCPRCGARLASRLLMLPPEQCGTCGVALTRPPPG